MIKRVTFDNRNGRRLVLFSNRVGGLHTPTIIGLNRRVVRGRGQLRSRPIARSFRRYRFRNRHRHPRLTIQDRLTNKGANRIGIRIVTLQASGIRTTDRFAKMSTLRVLTSLQVQVIRRRRFIR